MAKKKEAVAAPDTETQNDGAGTGTGDGGIVVELKLAKVTAQGALRYEEKDDGSITPEHSTIKIGTLYIQKGTLPEPAPDRIRITIETI